MKRQFAAISAAFLMTACIGAAMLAIGGAAWFNPNSTAPANSGTEALQVSADASAAEQAQLQQLRDLVTQYQTREKEYQAREQQYQQELEQAHAQVQQAQQQMQQVQTLLQALQQRGLITITADGQIFINR